MKKPINRFISVKVAAAGIVLFLLAGAQVHAAGSQMLPGHVPSVVAHLQSTGLLDRTNHLKLAIGLPLRHKAGLTNLLQQLYDPASANYHEYLSVAQFTDRFGPAAADYQALIAFANANNLTVTATHPNRMLLDVEAPVADIEKALHTSIRVYQHPTENRTFFAPDTEPSVDLSLPVLHISGLDNYVLPRPLLHRKASPNGHGNPLGGGPTNAPLDGSGPDASYLGYDFRTAYAPGVTLTGAGQNAALFEYDGYFISDIITYEDESGLPSVNLVNIPIDGGVNPSPFDGGVGEVSLDIEMVIAMAPGISTLYVYESPEGPCDDVFSRMATDNSSKQISSSWGFRTDPTSEQLFQEFAAQGQSFYQASGDSDAYVGPISTPEDDPNITLVGGTELVMNGTGASYASESVWNTGYAPPGGAPQFDNYWGSGGGISTVWSIPSWQVGVSMTNNGGSTGFRNTPDVAMTADNIWVEAGEGFQSGVYEGTSCAAPLWNGFTALINQQAASASLPPVGFINPAVYAIGAGLNYTKCFNDITNGNNIWPGSGGLFNAVPGYDLCTGWGSPTGSNLINILAPPKPAPNFAVVTNIITGGNGNGIIDVDECNNITIVLTNKGNLAATGVEATLSSTTMGAIVAQSTAAYPDIFPRFSAANLTLFTLSTQPTFVCGTPINLTLVVKCDQIVQTNYIQLPTGIVGPPVVFTNLTATPLPHTNPIVNSPIVVSGLETVASLTVSVYLTTIYDGGITLQLISPSGTNVLLSQYNGDFAPNYGSGCGTNSETTFDDAASNSIVDALPPYIGSFQPQQPLSVFHLASGTNLNGTWNLQVQDAYSVDTAVLECWSLNISPELCVDGGGQCPGSDLSLTMSASPNPVFVNSNVVYTMTVSNAGPGPADSVVISQTLPPGFESYSTSNSPVSSSLNGTNLTLVLGTLPVYGSATVYVIVPYSIPGLATSTATVGSEEVDPNPANNSASVAVLVTEQNADVAVSMTGSPSAVLQAGLLTYTIDVTNNGPFTADNVTLATTLPANANFVSAAASQGTVIDNGTFATLGNIGLGTNVVVTITISPTVTGSITASTVASITNTQMDPNTFNNSASVSTTVGPAAELGVTGFATPSPVIEGSNLSYILTVSNAGPSAATGVGIIQTVPAGSTFVSSSLANISVSTNLISAAVTTNLAVGGRVLITNVFKSPTNLQLMVSTITVSGSPNNPYTNNEVVTLQTLAEPPTVTIVAAGATVIAGSTTGSIGPTGAYTVKLYLQNVGNIPTAANLVATLLSGPGITATSGSQNYGVLTNGANPTAGQYSFTTSSSNGGAILAVLQLQVGSSNLGTVTNTFVMPVVQTFSNTSFISIPNQEYISEPDDGPANPYPSAIVVSNVNGDVSTVTVTVSNLIHTYPNDIGMLLIGPTGANCVLMSATAQYTTMPESATLTFAESAPYPLPNNEEIVSGSFQPADYYASQYGKTEIYTNAPAPVGPYNTNLSVFTSIAANGTWSLYVYDFTQGDAGAVSNGWSLAITTITPVNQEADLEAGIVALPNQVILGGTFTNLWTVTNNGPDAAAAFVTNILPAGLAFVTNMLPPGATSSRTGATNICSLGNILPGGSAVVTNVVTAIADGPQTNVITVGFTVGSIELDPNLANNTASVVTTVNPPPVSLTLAPISVVPNPVVVGSTLVYTLSVTNNGPSNDAFNVVGTLALPPSLHFVSALPYPSAGASYVYTNGSVQTSFGTIDVGSYAEVTVTATALSAGVVTNVWSVTTTCNNTNSANDSVSTNITVIYPTAVITNGPTTLVAQNSPPLNGAINSNQTNTVAFTLVNVGSGPTTNLVATLLANSGVRPVTVSRTYGPIAAGGFATQPFTFVASGSPGATITAEFSLQNQGNTNLGPVFFTFILPMTQTFNNSGEITIPYQGPGNPYPSVIQVSGLTNGQASLSVANVTATLNGFTHSWPHDVEVVLVSPAGEELVLMEHTGTFYSVTNLVLTFENGVAQELPLASALSSGTFLATEYSPFDILPGVAAVPAASTNLSVFNGTNPNGAWLLYVYDDTAGNDGVISEGWSLGLTVVSPVSQLPSLSASRLAGELLQLTVGGTSGQAYEIQYSSNLISWAPLTTNTGSFTYTSSLTNAPQRFYRVIPLP
jgi:uncharacterized repeat protein (TIGR01451 family)